MSLHGILPKKVGCPSPLHGCSLARGTLQSFFFAEQTDLGGSSEGFPPKLHRDTDTHHIIRSDTGTDCSFLSCCSSQVFVLLDCSVQRLPVRPHCCIGSAKVIKPSPSSLPVYIVRMLSDQEAVTFMRRRRNLHTFCVSAVPNEPGWATVQCSTLILAARDSTVPCRRHSTLQ